jgi:tetratricopeptide (TPR) repeat protein
LRRDYSLGSIKKIIILFILCFIFLLTANGFCYTTEEIFDMTINSVVTVVMEDSKGKEMGFGSGFFIGEGIIVTNHHVIEESKKGYVNLVGKKTKYDLLKIIAEDKKRDLAVISVSYLDATPLPIIKEESVTIGEKVYVIGTPLGFEGTISEGIISGIRSVDSRNILQITAPVSPGSSGGPVLNSNGEVIGIAFLTAVKGQNVNFAIPISDLLQLINERNLAIPSLNFVSPIKKDISIDAEKESFENKDSISVFKHFSEAYSFISKNKYDEATVLLEDILENDPNYFRAYYYLGLISKEKGDFEKAIEHLNRALEIEPDYKNAKDLLLSINTTIKKQKREEEGSTYQTMKDLEETIKITYDDMTNLSTFHDKRINIKGSNPKNENDLSTNICVYFIKEENGNLKLRLRINYIGPKNLMIRSFLIKTDDERFTVDVLEGEITRNLGRFPFYRGLFKIIDYYFSSFIETYDVPFDTNLLNIVNKIITSKEAKIRHNGQGLYYDRDITSKEKEAMKNVIDYFITQGGDLEFPDPFR